MEDITIQPIGIIHGPFPDKFGVPRRSGLIKNLNGVIELLPEYSPPGIEKGLDGFSHLWVIFQFHKYAMKKNWSPTVRPPRLGGNKKMGVFASRSPQRPNFIGMSVVKLEKVKREKGRVFIFISGIDMIDKTPVLDLKPYIPDSDKINRSRRGWIDHLAIKQSLLKVAMVSEVKKFIKQNVTDAAGFTKLIKEVISKDPRPAYLRNSKKKGHKNKFVFAFDGYDIEFVVEQINRAIVTGIKAL